MGGNTHLSFLPSCLYNNRKKQNNNGEHNAYFRKIASLIIGLIALYWIFTIIGEYFKCRNYLNSYWRSEKFTGAYFHFLGLKIVSFKCTSESACVNWGFFFGVVTHALYIGAMWGIVKGIVMYFG